MLLPMPKKKIQFLKPHERVIGLQIDETALEGKVEFDLTTQSFVGRPTIPASQTLLEKRQQQGLTEDKAIAVHALNIMIQGLILDFKQLIAFHYTDQSFCAKAVKRWLVYLIQRLEEIGFMVYSITTDMSPQNIAL